MGRRGLGWLRWLAWRLGGAAVLYGALLALLWWGQEKLLFVPQVLAADHRFLVDADVHETWVEVPGARLNALHLRLPRPDGVVFFLHGNAGSLDNWFVDAEFYRQANMDLFMIDFRGYGKSGGRIQSEAQLLADVRAAWDSISARYEGTKRVIYGRSLGSGLAALLSAELSTELSTRVLPELTVLVSPYFSMQALAGEHYPWVPTSLLRYPLRTDLALKQIRGRVWIAHGERDNLIPPSHARRLHALKPGSTLLLLPQSGHNDVQESPAYLNALAAELKAR